MSQRTIRNLMIGIILIVIIAVIVAIYIPKRHTAPMPKAVNINTTGQPMIGNQNAKLKIVAFEDLKCSNCMRFNTLVFPKIYDQYIKTGKANYTVITLAFIPGSPAALNAAKCVYAQNHQAFFDYVKYIYNHQPPENENWATIPNLMLYATHVKGIDADTLSKCLVNNTYSQTVFDNMDVAKKVMGDNVATPSIYVNGVQVTPPTFEQFQHVSNEVD